MEKCFQATHNCKYLNLFCTYSFGLNYSTDVVLSFTNKGAGLLKTWLFLRTEKQVSCVKRKHLSLDYQRIR